MNEQMFETKKTEGASVLKKFQNLKPFGKNFNNTTNPGDSLNPHTATISFKDFVQSNINAFIFLLIAILFAVVNSVYVYQSLYDVKNNVATRQNAQKTLNLANQLITNLTLAQTTLRGYVLTGHQELSQPYNDAIIKSKQQLKLLANVQLSNQDKQYVNKLCSLIDTQLRSLENINHLQTKNHLIAFNELNKAESKQLANAINLGHQQLVDSQAQILNLDEAQFQSNMQKLNVHTSIRSAVIILFTFAFAYFFYYQTKQKAKNKVYANTQKLLLVQQEMSNKLVFANKILKDNEEKLSQTLDSIGHGLIATDLFACVTRINKVAQALTGWSESDAIARPIDEVCNLIDIETLLPVTSQAIDTISQSNLPVKDAKNGLISKTGLHYFIENNCAPIFNAHNTVQGAVFVFNDISAQELAQQQLLQSEALYKATFDKASVGIVNCSINGQFLRANDCFSLITKYSNEELLQLTFQDITHPDDLNTDMAYFEQLLSGEIDHYNMEKRYICKDKTIVWVNLLTNCIRKPTGEIDYFIGVVENITDKKKAMQDSRQFFSLSQELLCIMDFNGSFKQYNETWLNVLGYKHDEIMAKTLYDFLHPEDVDATKEALSVMRVANSINGLENRFICKNGDIKTMLWSVSADIDAHVMYASGRDITERKQFEQDLQLQAGQFKTLLEEAPIGIYLVDKDLNVLHHNSLALNAYANKKELEGCNLKTLFLLNDEQEAENFIDLFKQTLITGEPYYAPEYKQKDLIANNDKYWSWQVSRISLPNGEFGIVCYFDDITQRVSSRLKTIENESRFRTLFDRGPVAMYFCDHNAKIQVYNQVAAEIWQKQPSPDQSDESFRQDFKFYDLNSNLISFTQSYMMKVLTGMLDYVQDEEVIFERADGSKRFITINIVPIKNANNEITGAINCFYDITQHKMLERELTESMQALTQAKAAAEKANAAKSEFLSSMSHELRTPLNAILGFAQLMQAAPPTVTTSPTPIQLRNIKHILEAGWYLLELINEVLDLAQIESGKQPIFLEPVLLNDLIRDCIMLTEPLALKNTISIEFTPIKAMTYVQADKTRLKQVLINLLSNAIKYNKKGGLVSVGCVNKKGFVKMSVRDTGIGLNNEQISHLFEPFNRLGQETLGQEGTGIGLTVCKKLIELMHGKIEVQSTVDQGSVFSISLLAINLNAENYLKGEIKTLVEHAPDSNDLTSNVVNIKDLNINSVEADPFTNQSSLKLVNQNANNHSNNDHLAKQDAYQNNLTKSSDESPKSIFKKDIECTSESNFSDASDVQKLIALQNAAMVNAFKKISLIDTVETELPEPKLHEDQKLRLSPKKLLYIEDDLTNFSFVKEMMSLNTDVTLKNAINGMHGFSLAESWLPDVILLDINLPDLNGLDVLKMLSLKPTTLGIPVIALSANAHQNDIQKGIEAGFFRYLTKPVKLDDLTQALDFAFEYAQMTRLNNQ